MKYIDQYKILHKQHKDYGKSSEKYLAIITMKVFNEFDVNSINNIFDFGCGKSRLIDWLGKLFDANVYKYDPAIDEYSQLPPSDIKFDLTICTDVLEHIPLNEIDDVLYYISSVSKNVFFVISTRKAYMNLPNGENAHCTVLSKEEWIKILSRYFRKLVVTKYSNDKSLFIKTW